MPNRKVHVVTSGAIGALFALHKSGDQPDLSRVCEALGGLVGGYAGGRLPDVLDPPTSPRHRGRAHSFAAAATVLKLSRRDLDRWQQTCRRWADECHANQQAATPCSPERVLMQLAELACRLLAGCLAGLLAGYLAHLALDSVTPCCLNLI